MTKLLNKDKRQVLRILADDFEHNLSVNYIVKQDQMCFKRLTGLMKFGFRIYHELNLGYKLYFMKMDT